MSKYDTEIDALFPELISETTKETKKDTAKLFGKDVVENFVTMATFCDGG